MKPAKIDLKTYGFIQKLRLLPSFQKRIKKIRYAYQIPQKGFDSGVLDKLIIKEKNPKIPTKINKTLFLADIKNLLNNYNLSSSWVDLFTDYVLFNFFGNYYDVSQILTLDLGTKTQDPQSIDKTLEMSRKFDLNPIAILLPSSISERELEDYIKINFKKIKSLQKKYVNSSWEISNLRQSNDRNKERDIFIYKHRHLSKKELMTKLTKNFGKTLDYTYINKIIKKEMRQRNEGI